jgi:predicted O-methyltransferase YrrM
LATRGRSTIRLRLPWLPFRLIDELEAVVCAGTRVFECGGGGSTLWLLDRGAVVVTVEHDREWTDILKKGVTSDNWTLLVRPIADGPTDYVEAIATYPDDWFDVVVVDGRARRRCASRASSKVKPGGLLLVDDVNRQKHARAAQGVAWTRGDVIGFAPAKLELAHTAVLTRPAA